MSVPYEFYIRGSSTFFTDTDGIVATGGSDSAPSTIKAPGGAEWLTVQAFGADPTLTNEGEEFTTGDGSVYKDSTPRWTFTIKTLRYDFPSAWADYVALQQHLSRRYLYLATKTYDVTLHGASECLAVTCESSVEHEYDKGGKYVTITLKLRAMTEAIG